MMNFLQFATSIAFHCQSVIVVSNKSSINKQISYFSKLKNLIDFINIQRKNENEFCKIDFIINGTFDTFEQNEIQEIKKKFDQIVTILNLYKKTSCAMFLKQLVFSLPNSKDMIPKNNSFFSKVKIFDDFL